MKTSIKIPLTSIIRNNKINVIINSAVMDVNLLITHFYKFFKLYCLYYYDKDKVFPRIDKNSILLIMKTLSNDNTQNSKIKDFYENVYKKIMIDVIPNNYNILLKILDKEADKVINGILTNIKEKFPIMVKAYVNILCNKDIFEKLLSDKVDNKQFNSELKILKRDILYNENNAVSKFDTIKKYIRNVLEITDLSEPIINMVNGNPLNFINLMVNMSIDAELFGKKHKQSNRIMNCFPLRKNITPRYINIDSETLILILTKGNKLHNNYIFKSSDDIWKYVFNINNTIFREEVEYIFNNSIDTDGIGCSIIYIKKDLHNIPQKSEITINDTYYQDIYIDELDDIQKQKLLNKKIVGIDPGSRNLLYCICGDIVEETDLNNNKCYKADTYVYTQEQKNKDLELNKYINLISTDKKISKISGTNIHKLESNFGLYNIKSCILENVFEYTKTKNKIDAKLNEYYKKDTFRKLKLSKHINLKKSKENVINDFKTIFGDPSETVICIGDYSQRYSTMNINKGKKMRKLFKDNGYELYLVDEYNSSCKLFIDGQDLKKGINECQTLSESDNIIIDRDFNGSANIKIKATNTIYNKPIPDYLQNPNMIIS